MTNPGQAECQTLRVVATDAVVPELLILALVRVDLKLPKEAILLALAVLPRRISSVVYADFDRR